LLSVFQISGILRTPIDAAIEGRAGLLGAENKPVVRVKEFDKKPIVFVFEKVD